MSGVSIDDYIKNNDEENIDAVISAYNMANALKLNNNGSITVKDKMMINAVVEKILLTCYEGVRSK